MFFTLPSPAATPRGFLFAARHFVTPYRVPWERLAGAAVGALLRIDAARGGILASGDVAGRNAADTRAARQAV